MPNMKKKKSKTAPKSEKNTEISHSKTPSGCLQVPGGGFRWDAADSILEDDDDRRDPPSSEEEEKEPQMAEPPKKKRKSNRRQEAIEAEKNLRELENRRMDPDYKPETALEYEELLQRTPKEYQKWIEYACFHLANGELSKATSILNRSLGALPLEEEKGRRKVWQMLLRLELTFGSKQSTAELFKESLARNDELKMFQVMAEIYHAAGHLEEAENTIRTMTKKFSQRAQVWIEAAIFYYERGCHSQGAEVLEKSRLSLPKKEHVNIKNRLAQLEFKHGDVERGKTIFETVLSENPNRLDIWFTYCDMLTKHSSISEARRILDRMSGLNLKLNKMRSIFHKFQNFEKAHGTPQSLEAVTRRVADYVNSVKLKD